MYVYGLGRVSADGLRIEPEPGTTFHVLRCTPDDPNQDVPSDTAPPDGECLDDSQPSGGDPCNLSTGLFVYRMTDLLSTDSMPIAVRRTYQTEDPEPRPFGVGMTHDYDLHLFSPHEFSEMYLVLPSGATVHHDRVSTGDGFQDAIFEHTDSPTARFYKSRIAWNGRGWNLTLKDGSTYVFNDQYDLMAIRDRYGNQVTLTRESSIGGHPR